MVAWNGAWEGAGKGEDWKDAREGTWGTQLFSPGSIALVQKVYAAPVFLTKFSIMHALHTVQSRPFNSHCLLYCIFLAGRGLILLALTADGSRPPKDTAGEIMQQRSKSVQSNLTWLPEVWNPPSLPLCCALACSRMRWLFKLCIAQPNSCEKELTLCWLVGKNGGTSSAVGVSRTPKFQHLLTAFSKVEHTA